MQFNILKKYIPISFNQSGTLSIKNITKKNSPFFIAWILILLWIDTFAFKWAAFRMDTTVIGIPIGDIYAYLFAIVSGLLIFFLNTTNFFRYSVYGAIVAFIGFLTAILFPDYMLTQILIIISAIGLGVLAAVGCYVYVMILNNAEKFYSILIEFSIARVFLLIRTYTDLGMLKLLMTKVIPSVLLAGLLICVIIGIKRLSFNKKKEKIHLPIGVYSVLFIVVAAFVLNEGVAIAVLKTTKGIAIENMEKLYTFGALSGIIILIILQPILKCSILHIWNFSFAILALGFIVNILAQQDITILEFSAIIYGCSYPMMYINIYYMCGIMIKKYQSIMFLRIGVLVASISGILSNIVTSIITSKNTITVSAISALISVVVILLFFMLSPLFASELYSAEWMDDMYRIDVTYGSKLTKKLKQFRLSPREIEVCIMLMDGFTMRQIAATLSIAYPTVNTHCVKLYKKLNINSRTELLVMFSEYIKSKHF